MQNDDLGGDLDLKMIKDQMSRPPVDLSRENPKIDLSEGTFDHPYIYHDDKFKSTLKKDLAGIVHNHDEREAIMGTFFENRKNGLNRAEMKEALRGLRDQGTISEMTERRVRREFGIE
ncbi:MAG: hypothetical protein ACM3NH_00205 [Candidatus Saccharibacteria bacterium]